MECGRLRARRAPKNYATLVAMKRGMRILWGLVGVGVGLYVLLTVWLALRSVLFPYAVDYGEGAMLWFTTELARGHSIYPPPPGPPFDPSNYPPVAVLMTAAMTFLYDNALFWGRALNVAAGVVVAVLVARMARVETGSRAAALLAAGLFLGSTFVYHWLPLYRVDLIGLGFAFAGIFCVWRWERERREATFGKGRPGVERESAMDGSASNAKRSGFDVNLVLALVFFLLALYTKHSLLFAPASAVVAIFLREKRTAIVFAVVLGAVGGAIFVALEVLTQGGWSFGLVTLNATVWSPAILVELLARFVTTYGVLLGLAIWAWVERVRTQGWGVLEVYGAATLGSVALAGREGAWENYFFEAIAMTCLFAGFLIARFLKPAASDTTGAPRPLWQWVVPVLLLVQLGMFWNEHDPRIAENLFTTVQAGNEQVAPTVRAAEGTLIAEDMGLLWVNGKPIAYYSFPYSTLARSGRYDQKWELENLRAGNFQLVVLNRGTRENVDRFGNFTRAFVSALDFGYARTQDNAIYDVFQPAPLQHLESRGTFGGLFELVGWSVEPEELERAQEVVVTVVWQARQQPTSRYTMFVHLEGPNGKVAQDDHEPHLGGYPTTNWAEGEMVRDTFRLRAPEDLPPGEYAIKIGWYDTLSQDGLSLEDGTDRLELMRQEVE